MGILNLVISSVSRSINDAEPRFRPLIAVYARAGKQRREDDRKSPARPSLSAAQRRRHGGFGIAAVEGRDPLQPRRHRFGMALEPILGCSFRLHPLVQDLT